MHLGKIVAAVVLMVAVARAEDKPWLKTREPAYPLKTKRALVSDEEIARARENIAKYPGAKKLADQIIKEADQWAAWGDQELVDLITDSRVPRAFETGTAGCARCGHAMYQKFGQYGWIIDPKQPFKVKCPNCGAVFPSNDYAAYYKSDMKEKVGWDTEYVDDGWGWQGPSGEKFWFVAYYNHWMWHREMVPGVKSLARAYLLTGDKKYAHKAAVMLHRIAQVYPGMDHARQSRYGQMMAAKGIDYPGKVVNAIWETSLIQSLAEAYDAVWETVDGDEELQKLTAKRGEAIRAFIEANILEDGIDAYYSGKVRGNFGMHQNSLAHLALVRQFGPTDQWLDELLERSESQTARLGLNYALYDLIYRDGIPSESSPGYNFIWVEKVSELGELFEKTGREVFANPRVKRLYNGVLDEVVIGKKTPSLGDSGGVYADLTGKDAQTFQTAFRHYKDPRYAAWLSSFKATGDGGFKTFGSLFQPAIEGTTEKLPPAKSRLLAGAGIGILNNRNDSVAMVMQYGLHHGHGHFDRLNIDVFANGQAMTPDLGYPDAMNEFVPGIFTWSKNTVSHNTVVVDAKKQSGNACGTVEIFVDGPFARVMEVEAKETYEECATYRRNVVMVDVDADRSYFVDVFTVSGGNEHDYSLHGPPGEFKAIGGKWGEKQKGTLAGENVDLAAFYDAPEMGATGYSGGFGRYEGSGFQHLFNVQKLERGEWAGEWMHQLDKEAKVRIRVLEEEGQQVMLADAKVSPVKHPEMLKYIIDRHELKDGEKRLVSRYVSVMEPFKGEAFIESAKREELDGHGLAVAIARVGGVTDVVIYDATAQVKKIAARNLVTDAQQAVVTFDATGKAKRAFFAGGSYLEVDGQKLEGKAIKGEIVGTEPGKSAVRVKLTSGAIVDASQFVGRMAHFANDQRRTVHPIREASVQGEELVLTLADDLIVGRAKIETVENDALMTKTSLPLAAVYRGTTAMRGDWKSGQTVREVDGGKITFALPSSGDHSFKAGDDVWLVNVGKGDRIELPAVVSWER